MAFDVAAYAHAMDEFVIKMQGITALGECEEINEALSEICEILRIAKVDMRICENIFRKSAEREYTLFERGAWDDERSHVYSESIGDDGKIEYYVYQTEGEPDWSSEEEQRGLVLAKMLYTFHGRNQVRKWLDELSYKDYALGIYNLNFFIQMVDEAIEKKEIEKYAACYFNLKNFSVVNQKIGRDNGTVVMQKFAGKLQDLLGNKGYVCRVNGDKFAVLFLKEATNMVITYLKGTNVCYDKEKGKSMMIESTAGFYIVPEDLGECQKASDIIEYVEAAEHAAAHVMYKPYVIFDEKMMQRRSETKSIEKQFRKAIAEEEFLVYYQPKVGLKDYRMAGAEALCRWNNDGKIVPPIHFIPILEQSQAICELDFYMLEHVCMDIQRWMKEGKEVVKVSVNFSRRHMGNEDLAAHILSVVDKYQVPHEYIEIELTETTTDVEFRDLKHIVDSLQVEGISTAVDDFGVGYSSLNLIRELPWDVLKIDRSFLPTNEDDSSEKNVMFKYLIAMAQNLGLECIVEGVETIEQVRLLKENNCYMAQGFYFDRPLPVAEFETRLLALAK